MGCAQHNRLLESAASLLVFLDGQKLISVHLNGAARSFPEAVSVARLIADLDLAGKRIAVERNGEIVPRSQFESVSVSDGDRIEVVIAVGGG